MPLSSGTRLGAYEILAPLGAGGMGEVYRATDTRLGRDIALKLLPEAFAADPERLARFEREAKVLASLNHPGIAHLYGFETATLPDGSTAHFLAMELVEGEDLAERLKRGAVPIEEAIPIARQIAEALEEAHEKGVVHRDLKPANVKLVFSTNIAQDTLFSVRVDPERDPPLGAPSELFRLDTADRPGSSYRSGWGAIDVTADGQRLLVIRPGAGATARRMVLVQNWLAEFARQGGR